MKFASLLRYLGYSLEKRSWAKEDCSENVGGDRLGNIESISDEEVLGMSTGRRPAGDKVT